MPKGMGRRNALTPLIEPYGIEINQGKEQGTRRTYPLIEPYGIEICVSAFRFVAVRSFNRTLWN